LGLAFQPQTTWRGYGLKNIVGFGSSASNFKKKLSRSNLDIEANSYRFNVQNNKLS
jgi:hypothetical protein